MSKPIMLDSGPLGRLAHPRPNAEFAAQFKKVLEAGAIIVIPEIVDYEVRRSFLLSGLDKSVARLDELKRVLTYLPLTTEAMLRAAEFWAETRKAGHPTAEEKALDGDVILAAQAKQVDAVIATENVGHLDRFVEVKTWNEIAGT